ncbi:MAG: DUF58 domain-containing protein [Planctomycetes bacterium]|nr:DUF58 domain-containing protein [Planctomycetota bacterium]
MVEETQPECTRLLDPDALAKVHRLELIARGAVEGFISGRHKSCYKGASVEFAEHRQYVAGDDIKLLDWRVYARTDRYYIKEFLEETNLRATVLLDASGSMGYRGDHAARYDGKRLSKLEYGKYLAATLMHLMVYQQDAVGLVTFDNKMRRYIPARSVVTHLRTMLEELMNTSPGDETDLAPIFHDIAERIHRRGLVIIISDLFDEPEEILNCFHHFRYRKHELIIFHVMAQEELTFPFTGQSKFEDLEIADRTLQLDAGAVRAEYLDRVRAFVRQIEVGCGTMRVDYVPVCTANSFDVALSDYLARRRRRAK